MNGATWEALKTLKLVRKSAPDFPTDAFSNLPVEDLARLKEQWGEEVTMRKWLADLFPDGVCDSERAAFITDLKTSCDGLSGLIDHATPPFSEVQIVKFRVFLGNLGLLSYLAETANTAELRARELVTTATTL